MSRAAVAALLALATARPGGDAAALLKRAERVREAFREGVVTLRVTLTAEGKPPASRAPPRRRREGPPTERRGRRPPP